jgi:8-oxo-dGTP diphosphatase
MTDPHDMIYCPRCAHPLTDQMRYGQMRRCCDSCGFVYFRDPVVAVVVLAIRDGQALMVKRDVEPEMGKWAFPAGYIDYGEDPRRAGVREVHEETGMDVTITRLIDVLGPDTSAGAKASIVILLEGAIAGGVLQPQDDASDAAFLSLDNLVQHSLASFASVQVLVDYWKSGAVA